MKRIWAPWRIEYIKSDKAQGCIFCEMLQSGDDGKEHILERGALSFVVMNKYPYTNGHLMVAPNEHTNDITALSAAAQAEMFAALQKCVTALKAAMSPHGFNIGLNLGIMAGAGIEDHLHFHVVPRWHGDNNFMPVLADCRVISEHLEETYLNLREHFGTIEKT